MAPVPSKVFVDTGAFIALTDKRDRFHEAAKAFYLSVSKRASLVTTLLVVAETYTWLRYHGDFNLALRFLKAVEKASESGILAVIYPDEAICEKGRAVLEKYRDQKLSYTDATSFAVLKKLQISDVFGFESHFCAVKCTRLSRGKVEMGKHENPQTVAVSGF
ncbi:MAG: PIN domain-containing protein [Bacillota bacterium]